MRESVKVTLLSTALMLLPAAAFAQSAIAGVVKDTSGAVMPGVSVEAASDVLIEKVRAAVTDGSGQYRIVDLRPGTYVVTFTLNGFSTVKREGIELASEFVASVNAEMKVGTLAETITVAGETPIVDVQSAKRVRTFDNELLQSLPSAKGYASVMLLIPSMVQSGGGNVNVQLQPGMVVFGGQGGRGNEGRVQVDGLNTGASLNGGGVSGYRQDMENAAEVAMSTAGGLGETEVGGPTLNVVPRTGGNRFAGHFFFTGLNGSMQSDNFTQRLIDSGLRRPNHTNYIYDTSVSAGGPIIKDKLWYFSLLYYRGNGSDVSTFRNLNAGDLTKWTYLPDLNSKVQERQQRPAAAEPAPDLPADGAQPREPVLGRADQQRQHRPGLLDLGAGNRRVEPWVPARAAGQVDVDDDQQAPARGGHRHLPVQLEQPRDARQRSPLHRRDRAVHGGLPDQRRHRELRLPRAEQPGARIGSAPTPGTPRRRTSPAPTR